MRRVANARRVLEAAVRSEISPFRLLAMLVSRFQIDLGSNRALEKIPSIARPLCRPNMREIKVGFFIHLHYEEYLDRLFELIEEVDSTGMSSHFFVTTNSRNLAEQITSHSSSKKLVSIPTVVMCQNRGRNFGPLFSEFSEIFDKYDYCVHLHSKKSKQLTSRKAKSWALTNWRFLGLDPKLLLDTLGLMEENTDSALAFSWNPKNTPLSAFTWGLNVNQGRHLASRLKERIKTESVIYPVGGMFLTKGTFLARFAKELSLSYDDFPEESGQVDGCLQHAVERCLGLATQTFGSEMLIFNEPTDSYYFGADLLQAVQTA